ncbi:MAG: Ig-like domain-containing protein [Desulfurivibrionaceae bacterium]
MAEEKAGIEIDDWLDDLADDTPGVPAEKEVDSGPPPDHDGDRDFDQSDIDMLLGGGSAAAPDFAAGGEGEGLDDVDQSDIDSLLGGGEEPVGTDNFDLDQSDIDGLFADFGENTAGKPETESFAEAAKDGSEDTGDADSGEDNFGLPDDGDFEDEFDFGDLPDIPDETKTVATGSSGGMGEKDLFGSASSAAGQDFLADVAIDDNRENPSASGPDHPPKEGKKKILAIAALCLVLLMGGGGYWYMGSSKKAELPPVPVAPPAVQEAPAVAPPTNAPPVAGESRWRMTQANESLPIELAGTDENGDPLTFEIVTPPNFGRLSGDPPKITYLPNKDFPGEDSFEFRVSDGQLTSTPAKVMVMGPEQVKPVAAEAAKECPPVVERPVVRANNVQLQTLSTVPLSIDWKKIWAGANRKSFGATVSVEILDGPLLRGVLRPLDRGQHLYEPDRYFGGKEVVRYRFSSVGVLSPIREVVITVKANDKPPVLALRPVADSYKVGENVVLDAGLTRDDSPGALQYSWEQLAGPAVYLEKRYGQASAVTFVVPSSFNEEQKTRIVIRVTATDAGGQRASKEIGITPVSKRQSALWGISE